MKQRQPEPEEQGLRPQQGLAIAWMLTCVCTTIAMLVVLALLVAAANFPGPAGISPLNRIPAVLLFWAMVTGTLCLAFTLLFLRTRMIRPPRAITIATVLIGAAPFIMLAVLRFLGR